MKIIDKCQTIIVIGASSYIGYQLSIKLASKGYNLFLTYNNGDKEIQKLKEDILKKYDVKLFLIKIDLLQENYIKLNNALKNYNNYLITGMIYCAGYTPPIKPFHETSMKEVKKTFMVNVIAAHQVTAIVTKKMQSQSRFEKGSIIFISSKIANFGRAGKSSYVSSKAALNSLSMSLAKELAPIKIRVNTISPGKVYSPNLEKRDIEATEKSIPMKRMCYPNDIANLVDFLLSEDADYINGENISLNGGR